MEKNVASQKLTVYVFDSTTNLPKTGDASNLTAYVSKDNGSLTVLGDTSATEVDSTNGKGFYLFDLTQAETNADKLHFTCKSSTSNMVAIAFPAVTFTTQNVWTTVMTESYAADGATMSLAQACYFLVARLSEFAIASTTLTMKKLDGSTTAAVLSLNDATSPTSSTRTS